MLGLTKRKRSPTQSYKKTENMKILRVVHSKSRPKSSIIAGCYFQTANDGLYILVTNEC